MMKNTVFYVFQEKIRHFSASDTLFFLAAIAVVLLNIIIRYPVVPHEIGIDSFFIHYLAGVIESEGKIPWLLSFLSLFGLYPYSYPSGIPIFLSELHLITGLELETVIYWFALVIGLLGIGTSYLLAGEFFQTRGVQLLFALIFSLSPLTLKFTIWTASTRGAFLMLLPLALWSLIRFCKNWSLPYMLLSLLLYSVLWSVHRLFILLIPITILCLVLYRGKTLFHEERQRTHKNLIKVLILLAIVFACILYILQFAELAELYQNSSSYWGLRYFSFTGIPMWINYVIGNLIELGSRFVLLVPFAALGLLFFIKEEVIKPNEWLVLCTTLCFLPFLGYSIQIYQILLPFICLLAVYGIIILIKGRRSKFIQISAYSFLIVLLIFSSVGTLVIRDISSDSSGYHNYADDQTVSIAQFLKINTPQSEGVTGEGMIYIGAYSGKKTTIPEEIFCAIDGDKEEINRHISLKKIDPFNSHSWEGFVKYPFVVTKASTCGFDTRYYISKSDTSIARCGETFQIYDNGQYTVRYNG